MVVIEFVLSIGHGLVALLLRRALAARLERHTSCLLRVNREGRKQFSKFEAAARATRGRGISRPHECLELLMAYLALEFEQGH